MIPSGNSLFENYEEGITCVYGEASTGKTTLAKLAAIGVAKEGKKVVYIDTENGFNLERLRQLAGSDFEKILRNIIVFKPKRFREQNQLIKNLPEMKNVGLIIIDTISKFYRVKVREKPWVYNLHMWKQFKILNRLAKKIPVIITNQVYSDLKSGEISMIGGYKFKSWSEKIFKLKKEPRKIIFEKPGKEKEEKEGVYFEIRKEGIFKR